MDALATFAAARNDDLLAAIERLRPLVEAALASRNIADELMAAALSEYDGGSIDQFRADLEEALELTTAESSVDTVAGWLAVAALNASVAHADGEPTKTWVTMLDDDVRHLHQGMHGVTVDAADFFDLNGVDTFYPGQPVGPIEHWINCRCVIGLGLGTITASADHWSAAAWQHFEDMGEFDEEEPPVPTELLDMTDDEPLMWHAIMTVEGPASGDKRRFELGALEWRDLPLPLEWQKITDDEHKGSVIVGRIDAMVRKDMGDHNQIRSWGVFTENPEADEVISLIGQRALRGVSPTVDQYTLAAGKRSEMMDVAKGRVCSGTIVNVPAFAEAWLALGPPPLDWLDVEANEGDAIAAAARAGERAHYREFTKPQRDKAADEGHAMPDGSYPIKNLEDLRNAIQAIGRAKDPAAVKRHIRKRARALGHPELIPDTWAAEELIEASSDYELVFKRGAGWVTHPKETSRLHRYWTKGKGAAKIRWGQPDDFYRCRRQLAKYIAAPYLSRTCAEWHHDALGYWPGEHNSAEPLTMSEETPCPCESIALVASAAVATKLPPAEWFQDPQLDGPTPLTVTREGRVFGHLATWGTCHLSFTGECVEPPHSQVNYAYFATGVADTDAGEVPVGTITMGTFHADDTWDMFRAREHYEHTGTQAARVAAGEDQWGIWLAGQMQVMSEGDFATFRASSPSGDWRRIRGNLELVGTLAVNIPGYPVPRATLVASAGVPQTLLAANILEKPAGFADLDVDAIADAVVRKINANQERARRAAALSGRVAAFRAERLATV